MSIMPNIPNFMLVVIPVFIAKMLVPLILVALAQNYICKNKPKYSLIIPGISFIYFTFKFILTTLFGNNMMSLEYLSWVQILIFLSSGSFFIVTIIQYIHYKRQRNNQENYIKTKIQDL